jgi:hypothetical protein
MPCLMDCRAASRWPSQRWSCSRERYSAVWAKANIADPRGATCSFGFTCQIGRNTSKMRAADLRDRNGRWPWRPSANSVLCFAQFSVHRARGLRWRGHHQRLMLRSLTLRVRSICRAIEDRDQLSPAARSRAPARFARCVGWPWSHPARIWRVGETKDSSSGHAPRSVAVLGLA